MQVRLLLQQQNGVRHLAGLRLANVRHLSLISNALQAILSLKLSPGKATQDFYITSPPIRLSSRAQWKTSATFASSPTLTTVKVPWPTGLLKLPRPSAHGI